ncbi:uncharacterized protein BHQ10_006557 [Talaromyces amestolkiae]|uniref:EDC4-like protein pdc1 beta-propeller domain-containing protein n=1 Tax=Talaromyces amestolkiae TaxID=1196081 RepID=A0A364L407_TALAM|nr:uncharacterized protein BHQ10_006557 [Talaromyces amestolkiae]RAO70545.1 hypothetical protein BHQ10_006557 [Talaromyces amestolkiae]
MSTPSDLQALFASMKPRPAQSQDAQAAAYPSSEARAFNPQTDGLRFGLQSHAYPFPHGYHNPSVSSPVYSPGPVNTPPHHGSDILSPNVPTPRGDQQQRTASADQAMSLLNLLKFSQNKPSSPQPSAAVGSSPSLSATHHEEVQPSHSRTISASDLVASFMAKPGPASQSPALGASATIAASRAPESSTTAAETQDMLMRLLNRSQIKTEESSRALQTPPAYESSAPATVDQQSMHVFGSVDKEAANFEGPKANQSKGSIFSYVNPFEQLAAASPRRTPQPKSGNGTPAEAATHRPKDSNTISEEQSSLETLKTTVAADEKLSDQKETVSKAVDQLAGQLDREVEDALSRANFAEATLRPKAEDETAKEVVDAIVQELPNTAAEVKKEIEKQEKAGKLNETIPEEFVDTVKEVVDEAAEGKLLKNLATDEKLADSWESAEDGADKAEERVVRVFNFPLRPFISITIKPDTGKLSTVRDDGIMDVARLKKEFDQLDRCLTSATAQYIVYALAKNGGLRIIRQDDGRDKQVFRFARDRLFNVALSNSASASSNSTKDQAIIAIGVSGTVYWAPVFRGDNDLFEMDTLESECLVFPPYPASDENTSGGQLKTRAKPSSRHPEFFGIGRGKNIYIVSPQYAAHPSYGVSGSQRIVDTEKFFKERAMKISTGKAGKDFTFSEDDTVVASLDKTGRLRFWDIQEVGQTMDGSQPPEVRVPLTTFVTGSPNEKSWPTSVQFIDKLRPFVKAVALRYVLVGLKQNHTLQLWDIGLGKAVQEVNFPHENESDAICSVAYHPSSGIIVVGHPTRNSIYFLHLSAPKYNLHPMSQADYIRRVAEKDSSLPKPESTACLSGIREISFASKGQLRSLDVLALSKSMGAQRATEEESGLFEIYAMYSRGVTCLNIRKEDLGWSSDNKIMEAVDALDDGYIEVKDLQTFPSYVVDEPSVNGDSVTSSAQKPPAKDVARKVSDLAVDTISTAAVSRTASPVKSLAKLSADEQSEVTSGTDKAKKKRKDKAKDVSKPSGAHDLSKYFTPATNTQPEREETPAVAAEGQRSVVETNAQQAPASGLTISSELIKELEKSVSAEVVKEVSREFDGLQKRLDDERRAWDVASASKTDQILRLVSSTLADNVEKSLSRIIGQSVEKQVLPTVVDSASAAVGKQLEGVISTHFNQNFPRELGQRLPNALARAVKQPEVLTSISEAVANSSASRVEGEVAKLIQNVITPSVQAAITRQSEAATRDFEQIFQAQSKHYEAQRQHDSAKIDQLVSAVHSLKETIDVMASSQAALQGEVAALQKQLGSRRDGVAPQPVPVPQPPAPAQRSPEELELADIARLASEGNFEEASIRWLQSSQQADVFDNFFVRLNPAYLSTVSPIVSLSVGVAVTTALSTNVQERLGWLEYVLQNVNLVDPDIREVAPQIMDIFIQRLDGLYRTVVEANPQDPLLRKIPPLVRRSRDLRGH